jgi:glycine betaine/proline transport system ATP-binding protein
VKAAPEICPEACMTTSVILDCRHVWKLYGAGAGALLAEGRVPDADALAQANVIGAVRDVNVQIHQGEIFVIMGLSGSGKSTLVRCLSRLVEPTAGEIEFDGRDLLRASEAELIAIRRKKMGMVFQQFALMPHLTVLENVAFPLEIQGVDRDTRQQSARKVIELVGLQGREDYYPRELSGGQQQRVGIAAAWWWSPTCGSSTSRSRRSIRSSVARCRMNSSACRTC